MNSTNGENGHVEHGIEYDYIVCGGGTSGLVIAARLAEDYHVEVLLIEAGKDSKDLENVHMVGGWSKNFDTEDDWNFTTEPSKGMNGRQIKASRGKYTGGSSGCNGTLCIRGTKQDYDDWNMGPNWSGEEMWKCMTRATTFHKAEWFKSDDESHGFDGPLHIEPRPLAPISNLLLVSMQSKGFKLQDDMFTTGNNPHGCGHAPRSTYSGLRTTAADYLKPDRPNLKVITEDIVDRIILTNENGQRSASAVKILDKENTSIEVDVKREIIPGNPHGSGMGSKEELEQLGIECAVNLPGVGKNLMDHLIVFIFYETEEAGLKIDHLLYQDNHNAETFRQWQEEKKGALTNFPFGAFAYALLDDRLADDAEWSSAPRPKGKDPMGLSRNQPHVEYFSTECYGGPKQFTDFPIEHKHCFSMMCELFAPRSRGHVTLKSRAPKDNPVVAHITWRIR